MELSRISAKGQVTVPKSIREQLHLHEGDRVVFVVEDGKVVLMKASVTAMRDLQQEAEKAAKEEGVTEEDLLRELENIRKEHWNERQSQ
ncbi:MAG: AbrB/MazE/SpoVT family DNA-binding domain-containing protein [Firmicutes bacterium]|nr:AbrB/MazE/SpoVT family DNA-binding domain-containing protein [Bacillota bacterium]